MQLGWGLFYLAVTGLTLWAVRRDPERFYAAALFANVAVFGSVCAALPDEYGPGVNLLTEFVLFEIAAVSSVIVTGRTTVFFTLAFISVISLTVSTSAALSLWPFGNYELTVNVLLLAQCGIAGRRGIANVIGRIYDVVRSRNGLWYALDGRAVRHHGVVAATIRGSERPDRAAAPEAER